MESLRSLVFSANFNDIDLINAMKYEIYENDVRSKIGSASNFPSFTKDMRECGISWIPLGKNLIIERVLTDIVKKVNLDKGWNYDLTGWQCNIQYTYYYQPQDHYDWHVDTLKTSSDQDRRLISIVYCLSKSEDYEGAELQFKHKGQVLSIKLDQGDFVVFKSHLLHRVTKLESGERETLVGWYQ